MYIITESALIVGRLSPLVVEAAKVAQTPDESALFMARDMFPDFDARALAVYEVIGSLYRRVGGSEWLSWADIQESTPEAFRPR